MGTPDFAVPSLEILQENNYKISCVVTAPDKPRGRGQHVTVTPVKECAESLSLPVLQPATLSDPSFAEQLQSLHPDLFVVVAFRILPKLIYSIPSLGSFNLHASLLPRYRGAAPINWAIINGEKESGVTTFFLEEKVDTGNIILQHSIPIADEMDAGELHDALSEIGAIAVLETVRRIETGSAEPIRQNDAVATPAPKIFRETCRIQWNQPAEKIRNFIRGLSPVPAAWTEHNGKVVKIFKSAQAHDANSSIDLRNGRPGDVRSSGKQLWVKTNEVWLEILELQQEGKKRMGAEEFLRGYRIQENETFR